MASAAILGAGPVGGSLARELAGSRAFTRISIVDAAAAIAAGKALDVQQCGPVARFDAKVSGVAEISSAAALDVIVVADQGAGAEWAGEPALALLADTVARVERAPIVLAGAGQDWLLAHAVAEIGAPASRMFGSAPIAAWTSLRSLVALECRAGVEDVAVWLLGTARRRSVVLWEEATVGPHRVVDVLDAAALARIEARLAGLWPPGPFALAAAAAAAAVAVVTGSPSWWPCLVAERSGSAVVPAVSTVPVRLGPPGVVEMRQPQLSPRQRAALGISGDR